MLTKFLNVVTTAKIVEQDHLAVENSNIDLQSINSYDANGFIKMKVLV